MSTPHLALRAVAAEAVPVDMPLPLRLAGMVAGVAGVLLRRRLRQARGRGALSES
ncbi:hypothetical protein PY257_13145 [Ramlibacter sp. H39-3-26]|uniref:hypothetical protein n=1 Tax=Curvibacter soli TaxID=3031331 RepID=UPI0023DCD0D3|nr:hypothetical protein [Ramlibacter sp. H39-3-26]MDF1486114.1 hypothetical protein [Ramlibacter sp. H39-3-26]